MTDLYAIDSTKIGLHPARLAQWLDAGDELDALLRVPPIYVEISPVGACSHRCVFCSVDFVGYKNIRLPRELLERTIADMARLGVKSIMYAGEGEPLLHREIPEIVRATKGVGIDVAFTTNATLLNDRVIESLEHVTWLKASVNGGTAEVYSQVHQTKLGDFPRVMANLRTAVAARAKHGWAVTLGAQIVLLPENAATVLPLARLCRNIGLDYLVVKPYSQNPNSTGTAERGYDRFDYAACSELAEQLAEYETEAFKVVYRDRTMANLSHEDRGYSVCHATPFQWCYLMASGVVSACSAHLLNPDFELGNIHDQSFEEIWHGPKRRALIERMRTFDISVCRKNCRMQHANVFLDRLKRPQPHDAFI